MQQISLRETPREKEFSAQLREKFFLRETQREKTYRQQTNPISEIRVISGKKISPRMPRIARIRKRYQTNRFKLCEKTLRETPRQTPRNSARKRILRATQRETKPRNKNKSPNPQFSSKKFTK